MQESIFKIILSAEINTKIVEVFWEVWQILFQKRGRFQILFKQGFTRDVFFNFPEVWRGTVSNFNSDKIVAISLCFFSCRGIQTRSSA